MANRYYISGEERAARVNDLFAVVAPRYDLINDLQSFGLHRVWKRALIRRANLATGQQALDVCCGTGDVAFALGDRGAEVTGVDFSEPMLEVARQRAEQRRQKGHPALRVSFRQADALKLPFPDCQFDAVTISYGLRNLASLEAGLVEMHRVLKPGGQLLVLDFGKPDNALWRALYFNYLRWVVPAFGWLFCGDAATHSYILKSLENYPGQRGVAERMQSTGFKEVTVANLLGGIMGINTGRRAD